LRCSVAMPQGPVGFCSVHLHTPRGGLSQVLDRQTLVSPARSTQLTAGIAERRLESEELVEWLQGWPGAWIAAGDFNMPADSAIYRASWAKYANAFFVSGFGFGYTKWTPIGGWQYGLRIDHIWVSPHWRILRCGLIRAGAAAGLSPRRPRRFAGKRPLLAPGTGMGVHVLPSYRRKV
jgi:endonuclease/exonuclease/phosphatase family metal-dependent hydrolase